MRSAIIWLPLCLTITVADRANRGDRMSDYFDTHAETCNEKPLDRYLKNMFKFADGGQDALERLRTTTNERYKEMQQLPEPKKETSLDRLRKGMRNGLLYFGVGKKQGLEIFEYPEPTTDPWSREDREKLDKAADHMQQWQDWFESPPADKDKKFLACGQKAWRKTSIAVGKQICPQSHSACSPKQASF